MKLHQTVLVLIVLFGILTAFSKRTAKKRLQTKTKTQVFQIVDASRITDRERYDDGKKKYTKTFQFWDNARANAERLSISDKSTTFENILLKIQNLLKLNKKNKNNFWATNDLEIKLIAIYKRPFLKIFSHELLGFCAERKRKNTKAYYFIMDRGTTKGVQDTGTRVSFYYLGKQKNQSCNENDKLWVDQPRNSKGEGLFLKIRKELYGVQEPLKEKKSFQSFMKAAFNYVLKYPNYNRKINCQHFATNMFNSITGLHYTTSQNLLSKREKFDFLFEAEHADKPYDLSNEEESSELAKDDDEEYDVKDDDTLDVIRDLPKSSVYQFRRKP